MKLVRCDRCKAEIKESLHPGFYNVHIIDTAMMCPEMTAKDYDLCEDCRNELVNDFINGGQK